MSWWSGVNGDYNQVKASMLICMLLAGAMATGERQTDRKREAERKRERERENTTKRNCSICLLQPNPRSDILSLVPYSAGYTEQPGFNVGGAT
jgi:hypothetical protein